MILAIISLLGIVGFFIILYLLRHESVGMWDILIIFIFCAVPVCNILFLILMFKIAISEKWKLKEN